ncbi:MAG: ATP-binding protein [Pseudorhodoplanes sp.]
MNLQSSFSAAPDRSCLGRVISVTGSEAAIGLDALATGETRATVGKFLGIRSAAATVVGMITAIAEEPAEHTMRSVAHLDLVGEIKGAVAAFHRGVTEYPSIGEAAFLMNDRELRLMYGGADSKRAQIGTLRQDEAIGSYINIDELVGKHFAVLGTTSVGKSTGVAIILQQILEARPDLRIFLIDPHNEYGRCFGQKAQVLTPRNLRLPFWLFNFEETIDAFFGGRPGIEEEVEILSDVIPLAKTAYLQYRNGDRQLSKRVQRNPGYTADTPVPYRIEDLIALLDERMGKLENRASRTIYHKLITRIQTFRNHPRYAFMFENANIGGDTMAEVLGNLFRLPANGTPMTIMQLAGFPAEVVDSVVSVLSRMAFDFGLWSDGVAPLLFVCEEAHRYAPADSKVGFGPTRRALSRIAKEGRKYGVFLGLVTQRPAEIDPTIISQCSTLFVMRLSNDRDQALIRSAVSDAAANLLSFIPTLGTAEVFAFGAGVPLPTRMKFKQLPPELRPQSETGGVTRPSLGNAVDADMISSVIERWRSATMSKASSFDEEEFGSSLREDPAPLQPSLQTPSYPAQPGAPALDPSRFRTLKTPLDRLARGMPTPQPGTPPKWR